MTDPTTLVAWDHAPPLASVHADARLARRRAARDRRGPRATSSSTRTAAATSTASRRSGATCTGIAIRRSTPRSARSSTASRTRRCSGSPACRRSSWRTRSSASRRPASRASSTPTPARPRSRSRSASRSSTSSSAARRARTRFASLVEAYHGDTLGAVGVGYSETFHRFVADAVAPAVRLTPPHVFRWQRGHGRRRGARRRRSPRPSATLAEHGADARGAHRRAARAGRGRHVGPSAGVPPRAARRSRSGTARSSSPTRSRPASAARAACSRASTPASRPTSVRREGHHRRLPAARRDARDRARLRGVPRAVRGVQGLLPRPHLHRERARLRRRAREPRASSTTERTLERLGAEDRDAARARLAAEIAPLRARRRRPPARPHGRHRAGRRPRDARAVPARAAHRPAGRSARPARRGVILRPLGNVRRAHAAARDRRTTSSTLLVDVARDAIVEATESDERRSSSPAPTPASARRSSRCALARGAARAAGGASRSMKPVETGVDGRARGRARARARRPAIRRRSTTSARIACARRSRRRSPRALEGRADRRRPPRSAGARAARATPTCCSSKARAACSCRSSSSVDLGRPRRARSRLPLLVVAANRLGTVNHCALTARVADQRGARPSRGSSSRSPSPSHDLSAETNAETIASLTGVPVLAELPHTTHPDVVAPLLRTLAETLVGSSRG